MRCCLAASLVFLLSLALQLCPAQAMQFEQVSISPTQTVLGGRGPIVPGDAARLERALATVPLTVGLLALALDSPGGNVAEGALLAGIVRGRHLPVLIPSNSKCVSACFLLLAASPRRSAALDALIGVHSAGEQGVETVASLAMTTLMARSSAELGVPYTIIDKMVQTAPSRVEWLDQDDLALMNVTVIDRDTRSAIDHDTRSAVRSAATPGLPPNVPLSPSLPLPRPAGKPSSFDAGRDDRWAWNAWLDRLAGPYRDGVVFAQTQIGLPKPGSCYGPGGTDRGDFTLGCGVAQRRLAPIEALLRSNPDYAAGWNSSAVAIPADEAVEVEYHGRYYCGRQATGLTLKVFPRQSEAQRRALLDFTPPPTGHDVPRGAFIVEGSIDFGRGTLRLMPVKWVLQPAGYSWLGLRGLSIDGGKTFRGLVIAGSTCTNFTLERVGDIAIAE